MIIGYFTLLLFLIYFIIVLLLGYRRTNNGYNLILINILSLACLDLIIKIISSFYSLNTEIFSFLDMGIGSAAVIMVLILLVFILLKKSISIFLSIFFAVISISILILTIFQVPESIGINSTQYLIIPFSILTMLFTIIIYFLRRQKEILFFLIHLIFMSISGMIVKHSELLRLVTMGLAYLFLVAGVLGFGNKRKKKGSEPVFGDVLLSSLKIRLKITLPFLFTATLLVSIVLYVFYSFSANSLQREINKHLETTVYSKADSIDIFLEANKNFIEILSKDHHHTDLLLELSEPNKIYGKYDIEHYTNILNNQKHGEIDEIFIIDSDGKIILSTDGSQIGKDKSNDDYFIYGKDKTYVKDAYFSETTRKNLIAISAPIQHPETKKVLGVLVARNPNHFTR